MAAYVIVDLKVKDPEAFGPVRKPTAESIAQYGGKWLVRTNDYEVLEGTNWQPKRIMVIEFPDLAAAKRWHGSPEYQKLLPVRRQHADSQMLLVNGKEAEVALGKTSRGCGGR